MNLKSILRIFISGIICVFLSGCVSSTKLIKPLDFHKNFGERFSAPVAIYLGYGCSDIKSTILKSGFFKLISDENSREIDVKATCKISFIRSDQDGLGFKLFYMLLAGPLWLPYTDEYLYRNIDIDYEIMESGKMGSLRDNYIEVRDLTIFYTSWLFEGRDRSESVYSEIISKLAENISVALQKDRR